MTRTESISRFANEGDGTSTTTWGTPYSDEHIWFRLRGYEK